MCASFALSCVCVPAGAAAARRVCVRACVSAVAAAAAAAARSPSERPAAPDVGEQLSPPQGCEPRSPPAEALRTDGRHACDGRSASRPSQGSARDARQADRAEEPLTQRLRHEIRHSCSYRPLGGDRRYVGPDHRQQSQSSPHFGSFCPKMRLGLVSSVSLTASNIPRKHASRPLGARVAAADEASARAWTRGARPANLTLSGPRSRLLRRPAVPIRPS